MVKHKLVPGFLGVYCVRCKQKPAAWESDECPQPPLTFAGQHERPAKWPENRHDRSRKARQGSPDAWRG